MARGHHVTELPVDPSNERGQPRGVDGLVLVMVLSRDVCVEGGRRLRAPISLLGWAQKKRCVSSRLELNVHGIMLYTFLGARKAQVPPGVSLTKVPPEAH